MRYGYYNAGMGSLERKMTVIAIRTAAKDLAGDLGECTDFQIIFCAAAKHRISVSKPTLDELPDEDLQSLYKWMVTEEKGSCYGD